MDTTTKPRGRRRRTVVPIESAPAAPVAQSTIDAMFHESGDGGEFLGQDEAPVDSFDEPRIPPAATPMTMQEIARNPQVFEAKNPPLDDRDEFSRAIGARDWLRNARMDGDRRFPSPRLPTRDGRCHVVSREYFQQRILLDVFANDNRSVRQEILEKTEGLQRWNAEHPGSEYGYLPLIRGALISDQVMAQIRERKVCALVGGAPITVVPSGSSNLRVVA